MKRALFVLMALAAMVGPQTSFGDPPMEDDGGGCTAQPCLGPSNPAVGQSEERPVVKGRKFYITGDDGYGGLVEIGGCREPFRMAVRAVFSRYRFW